MLTEGEMEQYATQVATFHDTNTQHQDILKSILEKYAALMEDYKRLKSDYEEERDSRERYKQMARGQERNPFVLVLVDGDGYVFDDDLVSSGAEGGQRAAQLLDDAVKRSMRDRGLDHCRVMVRVYANLVGLSKALARSNIVGKEKRSLAPFTANFTRSNDLFDFVDAGELKENADFKIRAMFRQFVENAQCRHIYFAGCHDVGYINELTPYASNRDRITLIKTYAFHPEFTRLGMRVEDFPNIFRTTPLSGEPIAHKLAPSPAKVTPVPRAPSAIGTASNNQVCYFFQKGSCKYGKNCHNLHIKQTVNGQIGPNAGNLNDIKNWRDDASNSRPSLPFRMSNLAKGDNDVMSGNFAANNNTNDAQTAADFSTVLPQEADIAEGQIPLNKDGYRLDPYAPSPSPSDHEAFKTRTARQKLCNGYQITDHCAQGDACPYDHGPVPPRMLDTLRYVAYSNPCPRKGACRRVACYYGHVCQKADCKYRGGKGFCKFGPYVHAQDLNFAGFVAGEGMNGGMKKGGGTGGEDGTRSAEESVSEWDSARPAQQEGSEWQTESDGEPETETTEGALLNLGDDSSLD